MQSFWFTASAYRKMNEVYGASSLHSPLEKIAAGAQAASKANFHRDVNNMNDMILFWLPKRLLN